MTGTPSDSVHSPAPVKNLKGSDKKQTEPRIRAKNGLEPYNAQVTEKDKL